MDLTYFANLGEIVGTAAIWNDRKGLFSKDFQKFLENELPESEFDLLTPYKPSVDHE